MTCPEHNPLPTISSEWTEEERKALIRFIAMQLVDVSRLHAPVSAELVRDWGQRINALTINTSTELETNRDTLIEGQVYRSSSHRQLNDAGYTK